LPLEHSLFPRVQNDKGQNAHEQKNFRERQEITDGRSLVVDNRNREEKENINRKGEEQQRVHVIYRAEFNPRIADGVNATLNNLAGFAHSVARKARGKKKNYYKWPKSKAHTAKAECHYVDNVNKFAARHKFFLVIGIKFTKRYT
jgi:hypothetical protein